MFIYIDIFPPTGVKVLSGQDAGFPVGILRPWRFQIFAVQGVNPGSYAAGAWILILVITLLNAWTLSWKTIALIEFLVCVERD